MKIKSDLTKLHHLKFFSRGSKLPNPPKKASRHATSPDPQ